RAQNLHLQPAQGALLSGQPSALSGQLEAESCKLRAGSSTKMRFELTGRHIDITPTLRRLVNTKLAKLERLLNDSAVSARAVLTREKHVRRADITVHARGEKFLHGVGSSASWEVSLGDAVDKIAEQAQT